DQARRMAQQQQQLDARYQAIARTFPVQAATPEQLAHTVSLARHLTDRPTDATALLAAVGQALNVFPEITLESLGWSDGTLNSTPGVSITLNASLNPFDGNYRAAMQRIERFMQTLQTVPSLHDVRLLASPVNADSSSTLSGRTLNADTTRSAVARFSIEMTYRESAP
ncbi:MAG TPA: hypothetical protein VFX83_02680, partial [Azonexus sp.]|nr:hypothetical protein [Azonexus sp.]